MIEPVKLLKGNNMLSDIKAHTVNSLHNTEVEYNDFYYMTIKNLFPEEFYQKLKSIDITEVDKMVHEVFCNEEFVKLLAEKFKNAPRRSDHIKSVYAFWQRHTAGYTLKPHVDSYPRVFTMTVYLAENDDVPEAGTAVYSVNKEVRSYETIGLMPYLRNSCMVICPYDELTWHGVNMLTTDINRDSVVVVFSAEEWNENQLHYATWKPGETVNYVLT